MGSLTLGGAVGFLSVWLTGTGSLVGNAATQILSATATATKTTSAASSTVYVTSPGSTSPSNGSNIETTIIQSATAESQASSGGGGGVSGGEAAGIAIGVLALIGIGAAAFFIIRRRRKDDYQKQYEGSGFGSSPGSLNRPFGTDQRLEPQMLKRESVGSLADEHDYSRKILRVLSLDIGLT
jgi:cell wall integrity and stress response component